MKTQRFIYVLVCVPSDDVIAWLDENIHLVCAASAVKFNIWDVVIVVLSLIIMSSDEIDSLGLFMVGFKLLQAYIMSAWHQMSGTVNHTFSHYTQYSARESSLVPWTEHNILTK